MSELARHAQYAVPALALGIALWSGGYRLRRFGAWTAPLWIAGGVALGAGATIFGFMARPMPADEVRELFEGVRYERLSRHAPRRAVVHLVRLDLGAPGLEVFLTPGSSAAGHQVRAEVTTEFVRKQGAQLAVNASYFYPWHSDTLLDYYPHVGDPTSAVGLTVARGEAYQPPHDDPAASGTVPIWFFDDGHAEIGRGPKSAPEAVSGFPLLTAGQPAEWARDTWPHQPHPRVAIGLEPGGRTAWILVTDGRQPLYSLGLTVPEVADLLRTRGVEDAILLDGGGSTSLAYAAEAGPRLLNTPVHGRIPTGIQRPVANHIGVRARPVSPP